MLRLDLGRPANEKPPEGSLADLNVGNTFQATEDKNSIGQPAGNSQQNRRRGRARSPKLARGSRLRDRRAPGGKPPAPPACPCPVPLSPTPGRRPRSPA